MEQTNLKSRFTLIAIVTVLLVISLQIWGIQLGQDLKGGTTLRFSLDLDRAVKTGRIDAGDRERVVSETIAVIEERINKFGLAETGLTPLGDDKFEISLPAGSEGDVDGIIDIVTALGDLQFRIEVLPSNRYRRDGEPARRLQQPGGAPWQGAPGYDPTEAGFDLFKTQEVENWILARDSAQPYIPTDERYYVVPATGTEASEASHFHVLENPAQDKYRFDGRILKNPVVGAGRMGEPVVLYNVKVDYQNVFGEWTGNNIKLPMAIVLNEEYYSAPTIQDRLTDNVQITLGQGRPRAELRKEAEQIATVLQTGSLKVRPQLESRTKIGASLAGEARERGITAVIVAFVLVLVFMVIYYHRSGLVANVALLMNVVLLLGTLAFFKAVLTLPGIAGIVLTVGMAVDANILINERIREERRAGRSLRRAVSEGYARAFTTIVDANVTSLITAVFLFQFGTGPVKGFAVTLIVGLLVSMFTSIFVTRTIFEWLMKTGRFTEISMLGTGEPPKISWVALRRFFAPISVIGVLVGLTIFAVEDRYTFYDVDFTGGLKLQASFQEKTSVDDVRDALRSGAREVSIVVEEFDENEDLVRRNLTLEAGPYDKSEVVAVGTTGEGVEITVQRGLQASDGSDDVPSLEVQEKAFTEYVRQVLADRLVPEWMVRDPRRFEATEEADEALKAVDGGMVTLVTLIDPDRALSTERLETAIAEGMPFWTRRGSERVRNPASTVTRTVVVRESEIAAPNLRSFDIWMKTTNRRSEEQVETDPVAMRAALAEFLGGRGLKTALGREGVPEIEANRVALSLPFPSVDVIGSSVARRLQNDALIALALSLLGIIVYIALRFHSRAMGLAAVICLFHDIAITLGVVAVANILGVVDAKISLPMVAAFLTLVGYSVNDTVVVFDRIRENRGKKRTITPDMIDLSISQTLARTIKTSVTFLLAALALFVINYGQRNVLEGFSFILIIGSFIGTYSTVAIASPLLLYLPWLWERIKAYRPRAALVSKTASSGLTILFTPIAALLWLLWAAAFLVFAFLVGLILFAYWALAEPIETGSRDAYAVRAPAGA